MMLPVKFRMKYRCRCCQIKGTDLMTQGSFELGVRDNSWLFFLAS